MHRVIILMGVLYQNSAGPIQLPENCRKYENNSDNSWMTKVYQEHKELRDEWTDIKKKYGKVPIDVWQQYEKKRNDIAEKRKCALEYAKQKWEEIYEENLIVNQNCAFVQAVMGLADPIQTQQQCQELMEKLYFPDSQYGGPIIEALQKCQETLAHTDEI